MRTWLIAALALSAAAPLAGQEWLVNREQFTYIGNRLTIEVATEAEGSLQIMRGRPGIVRVAGRVPRGFAAAGLSASDQLTLSAAGSGPVQYLISVPEGVWVNIRLPDRYRSESVGGHARMRTFEWAATASRDRPVAGQGFELESGERPGDPGQRLEPRAGQRPEPRAADPVGDGLLTALSAERAPDAIALPVVGEVRRLTVRMGADRFRVASSRPMSLERGDPRLLEIRATAEPVEIAIDIPAGTAEFTLLLSGRPALAVEGGTPSVACTPVTQQWLSGGRRWFTFTPGDGRWCDPASPAATPSGTKVDTQTL